MEAQERNTLDEEGGSSTTKWRDIPLWARSVMIVGAVNWFVFFAVSRHFHGSALGTHPTPGWYYLENKERATEVSRTTWLFLLAYDWLALVLLCMAFGCVFSFSLGKKMPVWAKRLLVGMMAFIVVLISIKAVRSLLYAIRVDG